MALTTTKRMETIARGLEHDGWQAQANSVRAITVQRDMLVSVLRRVRPALSGELARVVDEALKEVPL